MDGESLMDRISPIRFCAPFPTQIDAESLEEPHVEQLDLRFKTEGFTDKDNHWFETCSFGRSRNEEDCVKEAFQSMLSLLSSQHCSLTNIVKIMMYIDNMDSYSLMNKQYVTYFGLNPPVRVCVALTPDLLPDNSRLVLVCLGQKDVGVSDRRVLHVQGLSHWAPANIGPYSQGLVQGDRLLISGSIGLVPGTMQMVGHAEAGLSLRHVSRVARVVGGPEVSLSRASLVRCYVTCLEAARQAQHVWRQREDCNHDIHVSYLQVSQLPRSAKVEWEVELQHMTDNQL